MLGRRYFEKRDHVIVFVVNYGHCLPSEAGHCYFTPYLNETEATVLLRSLSTRYNELRTRPTFFAFL